MLTVVCIRRKTISKRPECWVASLDAVMKGGFEETWEVEGSTQAEMDRRCRALLRSIGSPPVLEVVRTGSGLLRSVGTRAQ